VPIAVTSEQLAIAESVSQWTKRIGTIRMVRALEDRQGRTSDQPWAAEIWAGLADLGLLSIAVPDAAGGGGGSTADVAVVAEQLAAALVPGPVLPTLLAGLVLAAQVRSQADGLADAGVADPAGEQSAAGSLLAEVAAGRATIAVALSAGGLAAFPAPDGSLRVTGTANLVLGAGDAGHLLLGAATDSGEAWFLLDASQPGVSVQRRTPVDFSRALADVRVQELPVPRHQVLAGVRDGLVADLAATLAAAEAAGVATWCVQAATEYARTRHQFGRPIGSFQAVKHLCAGMLGRAELAAASAWDAACAADQAPDELPLAAAAAAALALDAAVDNAKDAIQVFGGIGFTWEHDAHLYLRRALALRQLLGGSPAWRARAAELALEGIRRRSFSGDKSRTDNEAPELAEARRAARLVATAVSAMPPERQRHGLAEAGYVAPGWARPHGLGAWPAMELVIDEELAAAGVRRPDLGIGGWAVPAIAGHGTAAQLDRFAEPTLTGEIVWCQLFSEPEAGSDLASLRTQAVRAAGGWLLSGQKVWTSLANEADWAICLARTDPQAPKHKGITYFLVSMHSKGVQVRPLREITGKAMFNEVFLDEVFVPDDCVVGEPGGGWRIARTTLASERVAMVGGGRLSDDVEQLLAAAASAGPVPDPLVIDQLGVRLAEGLALSVMDERLASAVARGGEPGRPAKPAGPATAAGSGAAVRKLLGVAHRQALAETALSLCGVQGAAADGRAAGPVYDFLLTRCLSIAGGTSQILLSLVAERVLGLPREEAR
jgi:alkylation response protein AidB-like acyl-CoA dehydrogenase